MLGLVAWLSAVGLIAAEIELTQRESRRQLERRFAIRADSAAQFIEVYAQEVLERERAQALAQLNGPTVTRAQFDSVVAGGGYQAAVLLDSRGDLLQVAPAKPALVGAPIGQRYTHLRSALRGEPAVSTVVPSAAGGAAIVAFAVPFPAAAGRRVFSGAFEAKRTPIAAYLPSVSTIRPSAVDLLDPDGAVVASTRGTATRGFPAAAAVKARNRTVTSGGEPFRVAVRAVPGTPWRLVVQVPEARLYAPLSAAGRWIAWGGLVLFVLASVAVSVLVTRLLRTRSALESDIVMRRQVERELREAQTRFGRAFAEAPIGIALVDLDGRWREVNRALCAMLRYSEAELLECTRAQVTHAEDLAADLDQVARLVSGEVDHCSLEKRFIDANGEVVWASVSRVIVRDDAGEPLYFIAQVQDVSDRRRFEAKLANLADHDALTGLFNRRRFEHELERQVAYTDRYGSPAALLMLDLDNFKYVNDTLGHAMGDELLVRVATALRERLRTTDVIARLGGDEFAIILPATDVADAGRLATALLKTISEDGVVIHERQAVRVSASIGIAAFSDGVALTPAELMMNADVAMYDAKEAGRGRHCLHDPDGERAARLTDTVTWAGRIRGALADDGFVLYAQPILDLRTDEIARHELLLRMVGDDGEHLAPAPFLSVAERFGLIQDIDAWVVRRAIALIAEQARLGRRLKLEVNLSGLSMTSPEVLATIERELELPAAHRPVPARSCGRAEHGVELDRGRVAAGRRLAAERLGHRADVVRPAAAADADVVDADVARAAREVRHLEARALVGLELDREQVPAVARPRAPRTPASRASSGTGTGWAATGTSTAARIRSSSGSIVSGPREQFRPTIAAPASARIRHAST